MADNPLVHAPPSGVLGLNALMVYGENLQVAVGLNHQLAIGSNIQICINPTGLIASCPGVPGSAVLTPILGSGIGGNMQLTIGTSASLVYGQSFDINVGPKKIELKGGSNREDAISYALCGGLGAVALIWVLAYGGTKDDIHRADLAIAFQVLIDAILAALLAWEMNKEGAGNLEADALKEFYQKAKTALDQALAAPADAMAFGPTLLSSVATIGTLVAPLLAVHDEEGK